MIGHLRRWHEMNCCKRKKEGAGHCDGPSDRAANNSAHPCSRQRERHGDFLRHQILEFTSEARRRLCEAANILWTNSDCPRDMSATRFQRNTAPKPKGELIPD